MDATAAKVLKPGYTTELNGTSREFKNSQGALVIVFVLALLFIFLVLAAQFESFIDPFCDHAVGALSMIGALLALKYTGGSLNVYSQIGLITLVGLITKHGILIVEFTNQLREQGMAMQAALIKASGPAPAPHLDDHRRHGAGRGAAGAGHRRGRRKPHANWLGDCGRHELGHACWPSLWCPPCTRCWPASRCRAPTRRWRTTNPLRSGGALSGLSDVCEPRLR
jgi:hypothetical protein